MSRLLVLIPDRLSELIGKGEVRLPYYNPGLAFDEVHILMTNDDRPDQADAQRLVGSANLVLHNLPCDPMEGIMQGRWRETFTRRHRLNAWADAAVEIAREIRPALMRVHGLDFNAYAARRIKDALGIPYVVSVHCNMDISGTRRQPATTAQERRRNQAFDWMERQVVAGADAVLPVYRGILPYLDRMGARNVMVAYNVLDSALRPKTDYGLASPPRLICAGRQYPEKDASNLLRAVAEFPDIRIDLIGDGPLHQTLVTLAANLGLGERARFLPSLDNRTLCASLPDYDLFAIHSQAMELNKCTIEALLAGIPIVVNSRIGAPVPELQGDFATLVDNSVDGYFQAIRHLLTDDAVRERRGRAGAAFAWQTMAPADTEARYADIYKRLRLE